MLVLGTAQPHAWPINKTNHEMWRSVTARGWACICRGAGPAAQTSTTAHSLGQPPPEQSLKACDGSEGEEVAQARHLAGLVAQSAALTAELAQRSPGGAEPGAQRLPSVAEGSAAQEPSTEGPPAAVHLQPGGATAASRQNPLQQQDPDGPDQSSSQDQEVLRQSSAEQAQQDSGESARGLSQEQDDAGEQEAGRRRRYSAWDQASIGSPRLLPEMAQKLQLQSVGSLTNIGRGRNTTRHISLMPVGDGLLADTPGFNQPALGSIMAGELWRYFPEMVERLESQRWVLFFQAALAHAPVTSLRLCIPGSWSCCKVAVLPGWSSCTTGNRTTVQRLVQQVHRTAPQVIACRACRGLSGIWPCTCSLHSAAEHCQLT